MNYIDLINQFWSCHKENCFSPSEIALYFYLLNTANSLAWKNPFREGNQSICGSLGLSEPTLQRSRDRLVKTGLLIFNSGKVKRELTEYTLLSIGKNNFYLNETLNDLGIKNLYQSSTQSSTLSSTLSDGNGCDINKLNKTKLKEESRAKKESSELNSEKEEKEKSSEKKEKEFLVKFPFNGEFLEVWQDWIDYRKEIKKPYKSGKSIQSQLDKLSEFDEQTAILMVKQSIRNQWQGIFELRAENIKNNLKKDLYKINPEIVNNPNRLNFKKS